MRERLLALGAPLTVETGLNAVGNDCEVHDFVVNTETHNRAQESRHFKKFLVETAMDAIEKQRGVKLDRGNPSSHFFF